MFSIRSKFRNFVHSRPFFIRLFHWEYWSFYVVYAPMIVYWLILSIRARTLFFCSAANPGIEVGGVLGESKINILNRVPEHLKPKTVFVAKDLPMSQVLQAIEAAGIRFPVIAKPNIGQRGNMVEKLDTPQALENHIKRWAIDFLIQDFIDYPEEFSVFHHYYPDGRSGITSFTLKKFLSVTGDGISTIETLVKNSPRALLQLPSLQKKKADILQTIPQKGEVVKLETIGNHCRGTSFLNGNPLIDEQLVRTFDRITSQIEGINFCRYDLKCTSLEDLKAGKNIKILEINGVGAEPAHIYDPDYPFFQGQKDIFHQWNMIYDLSFAYHREGVPFISFKEVRRLWKEYSAYKKVVKAV